MGDKKAKSSTYRGKYGYVIIPHSQKNKNKSIVKILLSKLRNKKRTG